MAVRLNVIMIQTPPSDAAARRLGETIVGELIGRPGIDLTLVDRLADLGESSTDRLTLESLGGDVAVLDWQSPQETVDDLNRLGFEGRRSPHPDDPAAPTGDRSERRIYAFDLRQRTDATEILDSLQRLLSERRVKTFALGLPAAGPRSTPGATVAPDRKVDRERDAHSAGDGEPIPNAAVVAAMPQDHARFTPGVNRSQTPAPSAPASASATPAPASPAEDRGRLDLDALVDRLDEFDP